MAAGYPRTLPSSAGVCLDLNSLCQQQLRVAITCKRTCQCLRWLTKIYFQATQVPGEDEDSYKFGWGAPMVGVAPPG